MPAAEIQHAHPWLERQHIAKALSEVEGVLAKGVGLGPFAVVPTGPRKCVVDHGSPLGSAISRAPKRSGAMSSREVYAPTLPSAGSGDPA